MYSKIRDCPLISCWSSRSTLRLASIEPRRDPSLARKRSNLSAPRMLLRLGTLEKRNYNFSYICMCVCMYEYLSLYLYKNFLWIRMVLFWLLNKKYIFHIYSSNWSLMFSMSGTNLCYGSNGINCFPNSPMMGHKYWLRCNTMTLREKNHQINSFFLW